LGGWRRLLSVSAVLTEKPWRVEAAAQLLAGAAVSYFLSSFWLVISSGEKTASMSTLRTLGATLTFHGVVLVLLWFFTREHLVTLREGFGLDIQPGRAAVLGITVALAFVPVALGLNAGILKLAELLNIPLAEQNAVTLLKNANTIPDRATIGFMAIVTAPLAEEGLFRGVFYPTLRRYGFPKAGLWITSLAFPSIHANSLIFIPLVLLAVVLTKLYDRTGNLLACISCHAAFNAFNFIMALLMQDVPNQTGP
jgi:membrane protease YdiL (CAAX protease family)